LFISSGNIGNTGKKLKNREFLRYFIGAVLPGVDIDEEIFNHPGNIATGVGTVESRFKKA
jgi:hypothetical protein